VRRVMRRPPGDGRNRWLFFRHFQPGRHMLAGPAFDEPDSGLARLLAMVTFVHFVGAVDQGGHPPTRYILSNGMSELYPATRALQRTGRRTLCTTVRCRPCTSRCPLRAARLPSASNFHAPRRVRSLAGSPIRWRSRRCTAAPFGDACSLLPNDDVTAARSPSCRTPFGVGQPPRRVMQPSRVPTAPGTSTNRDPVSDQMVLRDSDVLEQHLGMLRATELDVRVVHRKGYPQIVRPGVSFSTRIIGATEMAPELRAR